MVNEITKQAENGLRREATKERREYLLAVLKFNALGWTGIAAGILFGFLTLCSVVLCVCGFTMLALQHELELGSCMLLLMPFLFGGCTVAAQSAIRYSDKQAASVPYIPPVAEQLAALPAEVILVRESAKPTADPAELLTPAYAGVTDPAEELLRAEARTTR